MATNIKQLPSLVLAGFLSIMMPAFMLNTVIVSPAIAQEDTDNDDDDNDTPVGGIETGAGGTANDADLGLVPATIAGGLVLVSAVAYSRRRKR